MIRLLLISPSSGEWAELAQQHQLASIFPLEAVVVLFGTGLNRIPVVDGVLGPPKALHRALS